MSKLWRGVLPIVVATGVFPLLGSGHSQARVEPSDAKKGYVLKDGEGEAMAGRNQIIKASPATGSQGGEVFWETLPPGFSTGIHTHHRQDEFFYVIKGEGAVYLDGTEFPIKTGDFVFGPRGGDHRIRTTSQMELVYFVDKPGLADFFRMNNERAKAGSRQLSLEELNRLFEPYGITQKTQYSPGRPAGSQ